jgi:hypothetical protein
MKNCRIAELPNCRIEAPQGRMDLAQHDVLGKRAVRGRVPQGRLDRCVTGPRLGWNAQTIRQFGSSAIRQWSRGWELLIATFREIFDENAYARFLSRQELTSSRASYLAFLEENSAARERRPRCC